MAGKKRGRKGREPQVTVTVRLPKEVLEQARTRAAAEERPVRWLLRKLIVTGLEKGS